MSRYYSNYITKAAQIILKEAENYTYQRLLISEENLRKDIQEFSKKINQISLEVKSTYIKVEEHERKIKVLSRELLDWESTEEKKICIKENITPPVPPDNGLFNSKNIISLLFALPIALFIGKKNGMGALLFVPAFFFIIRISMNYILKNADEHEWDQYHKHNLIFRDELQKKIKLTDEYLSKKNLLNDIQINLLPKLKSIKSNFKKESSELRTKIVVFKKTLQGFKHLKRKANERERTAKINAFESKNRSGAQLIKEKLVKSLKSKYDWKCIYCSKVSVVDLAEADHIHPVNKGGLTTIQNMVLICKDCNSKKSNKTLRVFCIKNNFSYDEICLRLEKLGKDV